jgi:large subunit ribosomal protein L22
MKAKAIAKNLSVSPKKLRPILDVVRGMPANEALTTLQFLPSPAAADVAKVVRSAVANAENNLNLDPEDLRIVSIYADEGIKLRRILPHPRGRAGLIHKRHSHITVVVGEKEDALGS